MNILQLQNLGKRYKGSENWAVKNFNLQVRKGGINALLGESGCGKTTLLRLIAGFEVPSAGSVILNGQKVAGEDVFVSPQKRKVGIVFQDYALFPHQTIWENIMFGLFQSDKKSAREKARQALRLTGLEGLEKRYPHQLSGGQKQRVALARAMAPQPELILFDEPFSNIDSMRKNQMRDDIYNIIKKTNTTSVFVTHEPKDVLAISDSISLIRQGELIQTGSPHTIYHHPVNQYVAGFFGKTNLISAVTGRGGLQTPMGFIPFQHALAEQKTVYLSIRPEAFTFVNDATNALRGEIVKVRFYGEYYEITCRVKNSAEKVTDVIIHSNKEFSVGEECFFEVKEHFIHLINN